MTLSLIEHGFIFLHVYYIYIYIYFFFFCFLQQENVAPSIFTVYHCRVFEQTNEEQKRTRQKIFGINTENVYKNEQNGTKTCI